MRVLRLLVSFTLEDKFRFLKHPCSHNYILSCALLGCGTAVEANYLAAILNPLASAVENFFESDINCNVHIVHLWQHRLIHASKSAAKVTPFNFNTRVVAQFKERV